jgi:hypothetical protein
LLRAILRFSSASTEVEEVKPKKAVHHVLTQK